MWQLASLTTSTAQTIPIQCSLVRYGNHNCSQLDDILCSHDAFQELGVGVKRLQFWPLDDHLVGDFSIIKNFARERQRSHATNALHENDLRLGRKWGQRSCVSWGGRSGEGDSEIVGFDYLQNAKKTNKSDHEADGNASPGTVADYLLERHLF